MFIARAAAEKARRAARPGAVAGAGAVRERHQRGDPPRRGDPGVRRRRRPAPAHRRAGRASRKRLFFSTQLLGQTRPEPLPEPDPDPARRRRSGRPARSRRQPPRGARRDHPAARPLGAQRPAGPRDLSRASRRRCPSSSAPRRPSGATPRAPRPRATCRCRRCRRSPSRTSPTPTGPDQPVLSDVSFEVTRGEVIGIIGPTGRRQVDADPDPAAAARARGGATTWSTACPPSSSCATTGTAASSTCRRNRACCTRRSPTNIRFERDLDCRAIERAARLAHIHDEIMTWAKGYETIVGPRADAVSGGQQQRLCLARALAATARGARARRAHERAGSELRGADPGVADEPQARADAVHHRPPHVHARHLRPRDGDHRRQAGRVRHDRRAAGPQRLLPLRLGDRRRAARP